MTSYALKNTKLDGVSHDTGWIIRSQSNCYTSWIRTITTDRSADDVFTELFNGKDYPGWTGVNYAPGLSKPGILVFTSTWDSGD
jgi:hypothetical protein